MVKLYEYNISIAVLYRPPNTSIPVFLDKFYRLLERLKGKCLVVGDINIDILREDNRQLEEYVNIVTMNGYEISNGIDRNRGTRVTANTSTIVDHVIKHNISCTVIEEDTCISDHKCLHITVLTPQVKEEKTTKVIKKINVEEWKNNISNTLENERITTFKQLMDLIVDKKQTNTRQITLKRGRNKDWINSDNLSH